MGEWISRVLSESRINADDTDDADLCPYAIPYLHRPALRSSPTRWHSPKCLRIHGHGTPQRNKSMLTAYTYTATRPQVIFTKKLTFVRI